MKRYGKCGEFTQTECGLMRKGRVKVSIGWLEGEDKGG
jgi:hypothetical protein